MKLAAFLLLLTIPATAYAQVGHAEHAKEEAHHSHGAHEMHHDGKKAILPKTIVEATAVAPSYIQLATNVEVIPNIEAAVKSPSAILTHEGLFGPLLYAEQTRSFFIELKPGMFLGEHPHDTGSIVYTVRGKWVLASEGKRQVMEAGSLFRFGDNMPTGWEAPFGEGALLLVVKMQGKNVNYTVFNEGIQSMKASVEEQRKEGEAFYYDALPADHPAIVFARSVNPDFDTVLANIKY